MPLPSKSTTNQHLNRLNRERQKIIEQAKMLVANVKKKRNASKMTRDNMTNFLKTLEDLGKSTKDGAVLIAAYNLFVAESVKLSFSVTHTVIRKKLDKDQKTSVTSAGIGIERNSRSNQIKMLSPFSFTFDNQPTFKNATC